MEKIIDGKQIAARLREETRYEVDCFVNENKIRPRLDVILAGTNPASIIYVKKKQEACKEVGILSHVHVVGSEFLLLQKIHELNNLSATHGILVQLPLPVGFDTFRVFSKLSAWKDVDVFHPENVGLLVQGRPRFLPCTPHAIQVMLTQGKIEIIGKHICIINRSFVVGRPLSSMLIQDNDEYANATVTVCHDKTPPDELKRISSSADIVVVAVGIPNFLKADMIKKDAVVIDVGITRIGKKVVGDVHPEVYGVAGRYSVVPGGVGICTVEMLLKNTLHAARLTVPK